MRRTARENWVVLALVAVVVVACFVVGHAVRRHLTVCGDCEHRIHRGYFCGAALPREIQELPNGMVCGCDKSE